MVVALLLTDASSPLCYRDLGTVAPECLHGVHSMWKALSIFQYALSFGPETPTTLSVSPRRLLSAFDAQVGDCACQIRPQILWELVQFYNTPEKREAVRQAVAMLQEIRVQASLFLQEIERIGALRKLSVLKNYLGVWQHIGFTRFLDVFHRPSNAGAYVQAQSTPLPRASHRHRQITVETEWDPENLFLTTRFLTICLLLSEFKIARIKYGPPIRMTVRVDLQRMYEEIGRELKALGLLQADAPKFKRKIKIHCEMMQIYVSIVTTNWMRNASCRLGLFDLHQSLSQGMIVASPRRISCVAAYTSMLLLRAAWLTFDTPFLVMIERFCSHGEFHDVYCRVIRNPVDHNRSDSVCEMGESNWFNVTLVSAQDIIASSWGKQPHIIMSCMSGEGTVEDLRRLFLDSKRGKLRPSQPTCGEIADYIGKIEGVNFARLLAHLFAYHNQFPFTFPAEDTFPRLFRKLLGKRAADVFERARDEAYDFRTRGFVESFTPEHIFLEFPAVALKGLKEKRVLYGCKLEPDIDSHFVS